MDKVATFRICGIALLAVCSLSAGCGQLAYRLNNQAPDTFVPNPLELPPAEDVFVWSQVVDAVDDYFRIAREQPVQNSGNMILDGRIETSYRIGASIFEPWRKDSTAGFEKLQSTLQSIRRRAIVIVRPQAVGYGSTGYGSTGYGPDDFAGGLSSGSRISASGYTIEVIVQKDLEDTDRTQYATEGTSTATRHDGTIIRQSDNFDDSPQTLGWIPLGRDQTLEQVILRDIFGRITQADSNKLLH